MAVEKATGVLTKTKKEDKEMINYEIAIIGFDGDIKEVNAALENAGIKVNADEAVSQGKESSVYVDPTQVGQAVRVINGLGYETDEDDEDAE